MILPFKTSIVIPTLNEEEALPATLERLAPDTDTEILVVDGGSRDNTVSCAKSLGATVYESTGGRGGQLRVGARLAQGQYVWLVHADTLVPKNWRELFAAGPEAACLRLRIDSNDFRFRLIEATVRARFWWGQIPYGDQTMWIRRSLLEKVGGVPDLPLFEDVQLARSLKRAGYPFVQLPACALTSPRRWLQEGIARRTLRNWRLRLAWEAGTPVTELVDRYRPHNPNS